MRFVPAALLALVFLPLAAFADEECQVTAVFSGDQLTCQRSDGTETTIHLRGIQAPELEKPFGQRSRAALVQLSLGKSATLKLAEQQADGSLRAAVWVTPAECPNCGHTLDIGRAQLSIGLARWRQNDAQTPEEEGQYQFEEHEAKARRTNLWRKP
ncbi:endonuclease YncB(thermonuclease family) [Pseudomonas nitritireducens]|uniref:Endonuclease YncB(Thermonuclease family) n=1 Tax=Pseudomonas nitroreducens TaxID=46680 RepID=A0A7W7P1Y1_PSENT|nr:thermonuclease family protein [Pseudomonas nitritireducens]MBB4864199.1 endonuclease YncB(thermonuclease family) [Pseudomonas nitritireducens]